MQALEAPPISTPISFSPLVKQYSLDEFWTLPEPNDRSRYELIGGYLFMVPPPDWPHEDFDERLNKSLVLFVSGHGDPGKVYHPRAAIYTDDTYLEPDMMYVSNELSVKMGKRRTSADIVFEYTSKSSAIYDRTTKADADLALDVQELWRIDSASVRLEDRHRIMKETSPGWAIV